jgi:hypothetical protein
MPVNFVTWNVCHTGPDGWRVPVHWEVQLSENPGRLNLYPMRASRGPLSPKCYFGEHGAQLSSGCDIHMWLNPGEC